MSREVACVPGSTLVAADVFLPRGPYDAKQLAIDVVVTTPFTIQHMNEFDMLEHHLKTTSCRSISKNNKYGTTIKASDIPTDFRAFVISTFGEYFSQFWCHHWYFLPYGIYKNSFLGCNCYWVAVWSAGIGAK